jgi:tRNA threonylcarbamoyl adenosine modification protein YeaZ
MELALDTSSKILGIALSDKGQIRALQIWETRQNHTIELLPHLVCLAQQVGVEVPSIDAVIVARGPGSYNGLRAGISTAKGLALALNIPLLGVSTLEAEAYAFAFTGLPVRVMHQAGREEIATALYRQKDGEWQCLEEENLTRLATVWRRTRQRTLFCGDIPADMATQIQQTLSRRAIIRLDSSLSCVGSLAALGWRRLSKGGHDDPVTLQPLYLRPPHITKPRERAPFSWSTMAQRKQTNGNAKTGC